MNSHYGVYKSQSIYLHILIAALRAQNVGFVSGGWWEKLNENAVNSEQIRRLINTIKLLFIRIHKYCLQTTVQCMLYGIVATAFEREAETEGESH